ncbi:MAG: dihydrofolate reductase [Anaerolineales bacterium]|nr:dihydrofolate reductase [Anaerolineales bacterium]
MIVALIVAMDARRGIGKDNRLPWRLSSDLGRFKQLTMGHHLIAGRRTFESIGKPLPGRRMIVLTRKRDYTAQGSQVAHSLVAALRLAQAAGETEAFVIGGGEVFAAALPYAQRIYLTLVHANTGAEVFFPKIDYSYWQEVDRKEYRRDERNEFDHTYLVFDRRGAPEKSLPAAESPSLAA